MYTTHFSLRRLPFAADPESDSLYANDATREIDGRLKHLLACRGIGLLTGEPGVGKTVACRRLIHGLNDGLHAPVYRALGNVTALEAVNALGSELGVPPHQSRSAARQAVAAELARHARNRRLPVIVVDEAHLMGNAVLEELRLLVGFGLDTETRSCLLLVGLPSLRKRLRFGAHQPLRQRLVINHDVEPLDESQCAQYVAHRLRHAGAPDLPLFDKNALVAIAQRSQGLPRVIDRIAHYAMIQAAVERRSAVSSNDVAAAVEEIEL